MVELIRLADSGRGAVQRELERLTASGLVGVTRSGPQKRYRANRDAPIFAELSTIVDQTSGVSNALRDALAPRSDRIRVAVLYGSIAKHEDTALSDIDVLVVSDDLALEEVYRALDPAEARLGRRVSPTLYTSDEFDRRRRQDHFVSRVLGGKHVVLAGTLNEPAAR